MRGRRGLPGRPEQARSGTAPLALGRSAASGLRIPGARGWSAMSVFSFLPLDERVRLRVVSQLWRRALDDDRNWRAVDFAVMGPAPGRVVPPLMKWALEAHGADMHDLSTRGCFVGDAVLQQVGARCHNLEVLIVDEPPPDRMDEPASIAALSAPANVTEVGLAALAGCHQLTRLDASRCSAPPAALRALASALPFLAYVKLGGPGFTDSHAAALVPAGRDMLALDLSGSPVSDIALRTVATHCPRLRMLNCEGSAGVTELGLSSLVYGCRELRILLVSGCVELGDKALEDIASACSQLHRLDAARLPRITNTGVERLADACEALESVSLLGCPGVTADGLAAIVSDCLQLRQLAVDGVGLHSVVDELAPQGLGLTALTVRRCGGLTDTSAAALASSCPSVTSLDLSDSPLVGFTHLAAGALVHRLRSLHSLTLAGCGVADQSLAFFPAARPRLATLDLSRNPGITDVGVELALRACAPTLTSLSLAGCNAGPSAAALISASGAPLTRLDLRMCPRINDAAVTAVLGGCGSTLESLLIGVDGPTVRAATSPAVVAEALPAVSEYAVPLEIAMPAVQSAGAAAGGGGQHLPSGAAAGSLAPGAGGAGPASGAAAGGTGTGTGSGSAASGGGGGAGNAGGAAGSEDGKRRRRRKKKRGGGGGGGGEGTGSSAPSQAPSAAAQSKDAAAASSHVGSSASVCSAPSTSASTAPVSAAAKKRARRRRRAAAKSGRSAGAVRMPLGDGAAEAVAALCPRLLSLHMAGCEALTAEGIAALETAACRLCITDAHLGANPAVTAAAARRLLAAWPNLRILSVPECGGAAGAAAESAAAAAAAGGAAPAEVDLGEVAITVAAAAALEAEARAGTPDAVVDVLPPRWGPPEPVRPPPGSIVAPVGPLPPPGMGLGESCSSDADAHDDYERDLAVEREHNAIMESAAGAASTVSAAVSQFAEEAGNGHGH
ncbi:hypothetical protein FNF31_01420 [Cafeteria roenbergensis]|uniref:Uncharacterized protein n=1 Tax=Cafeteria roenbergensis TaxID=33653 RepID=A0A5A8DNA7_CAFRO|nr:hypothetical protein FNF31_01420 [Cafeteria roenbergensis]